MPSDIVMNTREVERAFRRLDRDLLRRTRREMAALSRQARDEIRGEWPRGPSKHGHSFRAVTSGTKGLRPYVRLNRDWKPRGAKPGAKSYVGWLVWGGKRPRDRQARPRGGPDGRWFYPTIARQRPLVVRQMRRVLNESIRQAGLD